MRISSPGYFYNLNNRVSSTSSQILKTQIQLSTGQKAMDLADIGFDVKKYTGFQAEKTANERYIENIEEGELRLKQTKTIFETIQKIIDDMQGMLQSTTTSSEPTANQMTEFAEKSFDLLEDVLNTTSPDGGRVLGGYTRSETISFDMFDGAGYDYNGGDAFPVHIAIPVTAPDDPDDISYYILNKTPAPTLPGPEDSDLYRDTVQMSESESLEYSFHPYEEWIQKTVHAIDIARKAVASEPTVSFEDSVARAEQLLKEAESTVALPGSEPGVKHAIRELEISLLRMDSVKQRHQSEIEFFDSKMLDIDGADSTETALKLSSLQTQLEASFTVTSTLSNLNLLSLLQF